MEKETVTHILYVSQASGVVDDTAINDILTVARKNNRRDLLSGFLVLRERYFMQLLEGPDAEVRKCFGRIRLDSRNFGVNIFADFSSDERLAPDWSMGLVADTALKTATYDLLQLFELGRRGGSYKDKNSLQRMLKIFSAHATVLS